MKVLKYAPLALLVACGGSIVEPADINNEKVFFAFDSAEVSKDSKDKLLGQSLYLKNHADTKVQIAGNCDERGTVEYNLALGARRANAAKQVLVKDGIKSARIKTISYGKDRPAVSGTGESVWKQNRNATTTAIK
ncbi:MAG: OmpA family protein [Rickettsiales bacterium]|jgi:peptidoglycan-associated lipoprotein|nr:OmpA family protein [Rickettsiales bacterium]